MTRSRRRWLVVLVALVALLGAAVAFGPGLALRWLDARLRAQVAERGVPVEWGAPSFDWAAGVTVPDLRVDAANAQGTVGSARVELAWALPPRVARVVLDEVDMTLDLPAGDAVPVEGAAPRRQLELPEALPALEVHGVRAVVRRGGVMLFRVDDAHLTARPDGAATVVEGAADLSWGLVAAPLQVTGRVQPAEGSAHLSVRGREGGNALHIVRSGREIIVPSADFAWTGGEADIRLRGASLRLGPRKTPSLRAEGDLVIRKAAGAGWSVGVEDATVLGTWPPPAQAGAPPPDDAAERPPPNVPLPLRLTAKNLRLGLLRPDGPLMLAEQVDGWAEDGVVDLRGRAFDGDFAATASFEVGPRLPRAAHLTLDGVDIGAAFDLLRPPPPLPRRPLPARLGGRVRGEVAIALTALHQPDDPAAPAPRDLPGTDRAPRDLPGTSGILRDLPFVAVVDLTVDDGRLEAPAVAEDPLVDVSAGLAALVTRTPDRLAVEDARLTLGDGVAGTLDLTVTGLPDAPFVDLDARLDEADCQAVVDALPRALLGPYDRVAVDGRMAPYLDITVPLADPDALTLDLKGLRVGCRVTALNTRPAGWPPVTVGGERPDLTDVAWLNQPFVRTVTEGTTGRRAVTVGPGSGRYVPLGGLPAYVGAAMFLSEEIDFYETHAINRGLVWRALRTNLAGRRFVYGGSGVAQQLVKNLFLTREKTLARKLQEVLVADRMGHAVGKDRVLELYLNCIEFGPDLYGIGPAARYYFEKPASALDPVEAVFLAMLKPAPYQGPWMKSRGRMFGGTWWADRMETLMARLVEYGYLTPAQADAARPYEVRWEDGRYIGHGEGG